MVGGTMAPRGHYLAHEVGFLAGVTGQTVGQWAKNGYIRSSWAESTPRAYSFQDVAEALVVHELIEAQVDLSEIKESIVGLRERFGADWPLMDAQNKLATYGHPDKAKQRVAYKEDDGTYYDLGRKKWQQMDASDLHEISQLLRRGGWPARKLENLVHIEIDPDRLSGTPTIKERRVAAKSVAELADSGTEGMDILRDEYDLEDDQIHDAQRWWEEARSLIAA